MKKKMNEILKKLGFKENPTFKEIFNSEISQKVVIHYWQTLIKERNLGIFSISMSIKDILQTLFLADKNLRPNRAIYLLGLFLLAKDENGMRQLRSFVTKRSQDRTWYRIAKDMRESSELITKNRVRNWVTQIDNKLSDYKPFKVKSN